MKIISAIIVCGWLTTPSLAQLPQHRGETLNIKFPDGFTIVQQQEGQFDASSGDVLIAVAQNDLDEEIRIFHASYVPVSNEEIPRFLEFAKMNFVSQPGAKLTGSEVRRVGNRNWGILSISTDDKIQKLLFYALDGSPSRIEITGKIDNSTRIDSYVDHFLENLSKNEEG